ncbi:MAG: hypothetical protein L0H10_21705 [Comamonas sp.]|uniref:hypothetical protein n=1 Tax=Comamonas sp. TaxID=34028 RepID=UPI00264943B0|nr:hypothetical protein [Comamonas sp.]MDN5506414.1 hypothetical protein [Comamonas sp.]MDN5539567.1 hypothetical protein [Comamonas sp.]
MTTHRIDEKKPAWGGQEGVEMLQMLPRMDAAQGVAINGYLVPRLETREDPASGQWNVIYDGRFGITATLEEMQRWLWLLAQVQAVGEGYSSHGANSVYRPNPHQQKVMSIGSVIKGTPEG